MGVPIEISDELVEAAKAAAADRSWSVPEQIEHWVDLGRQLEARQARRLEELGGDRYADLDVFLLKRDDGGAEVVREQRDAGIRVHGIDDDGEPIST